MPSEVKYNPNQTYKRKAAEILSQKNLGVPQGSPRKSFQERHSTQRLFQFLLSKFSRISLDDSEAQLLQPSQFTHELDFRTVKEGTDINYSSLPDLTSLYDKPTQIAQGGQGIICQGTDRNLNRVVAIKTLKKDNCLNADYRREFITEAKITAMLEHPGIIPIYNLCKDSDNGLHLAMKLVQNQTLAEYLEKIDKKYQNVRAHHFQIRERINLRLEIFLKICDAISYAHSKGIIHCDLKPENILIGEFGQTYVMDWGLARIIRDKDGNKLPSDGNEKIDGTPCFIPPEAFDGAPRDERSDIYALGLILYEIVTLNRGFPGDSLEEVIIQVRYGTRNPVVHRHNYPIDPTLVAIIDKASAYEPEDRYQSVKELATDVRRYLSDNETVARPDNVTRRLIRIFTRFREGLLIIAFLSIIAAMISSGQNAKRRYELGRLNEEHGRIITQNLRQERVLTLESSQIIQDINKLDNKFTIMENQLQTLVTLVSTLYVNSPPNPDAPGLVCDHYREFSPGGKRSSEIIYSDFYGTSIAPLCASWQCPTVLPQQEMSNWLLKLRPATTFMQTLILSTAPIKKMDKLAPGNLRSQPLASKWCNIGLENGIVLAYPGNANFSETYDVRNEYWYKQAFNENNTYPSWGKALPDAREPGNRIAVCHAVIRDSAGIPRGVAAFDLFGEWLENELNYVGSHKLHQIIGQFVTDSTGSIIIQRHGQFAQRPNIFQSLPLNSESMFDYILNEGGYGFYRSEENGRPVVYFFAKIQSLNWYFIEKALISDITNF